MRSESKKKVTFKGSDQVVVDDKSKDKSRNQSKALILGKDKSTLETIQQSTNQSPKMTQQKDIKKEKQYSTLIDMPGDKKEKVELKKEIDKSRTSKSIEKPQIQAKPEPFTLQTEQLKSQIVSPDKTASSLSLIDVKSEKIKVAIRVRPFLKSEIAKENVCYVAKNNKQIRVSDLSHTVEGTYDRVYSKESTQTDIYQFVSDCIPNLLQGFNCTIFAYGQTGSGKTYTMFGNGYDKLMQHSISPQSSVLSGKAMSSDDYVKFKGSTNANTTNVSTDTSLFSNISIAQERGIIPRCIQELFATIKKQQHKVTIYCSFLQIYNEKLYDLLQDSQTKNPLQIREEKLQGIYVEGISEYIVQNEFDCMTLLSRGEKNRIKRSTKMNIKSSRSHSLFQLLIETDQVDAKGMLKRSKLNLGDLAGSEKINKEEEMQAKHMLELRNINLSLTTLGKVIQLLSSSTGNSQNPPHIPFRESKLTRLLQDSIGGNTSTYLVATVSPLLDSIEETISTLKFADRAKQVMQRVKKNEINAKDDALVQKLQKEVQYLKELLAMRRKGNNKDISLQLYVLKDENERLRQMALNYDEIEKMKQENKLMRLELQKLRNVNSEVGSSYNGDSSPRSLNGAKFNISMLPQSLNYVRKRMEEGSQSDPNQDEDISDSEDIQKHFQTYQSQTELVKITKQEPKNKQQIHSSYLNQLPEAQTERSNISHRGAMNSSTIVLDSATLNSKNKQDQILSLKQQKQRLQHVIQEQQQLRSLENASKSSLLRKRTKGVRGSESSDEAHQEDRLMLPVINESQHNLKGLNSYQFTRKNSNQDILKSNGSPYTFNRINNNKTQNPILKVPSHNLSEIKTSYIRKYPNQRNTQNVRMSLGSISDMNNPLTYQYPNAQVAQDINRSYQLGSQGFVGLNTQSSSLYGGGNASNGGKQDHSPQTMVRIRGKHNQMIETKGSLMMSLDEEKRIQDRKKQIRRSNERLKMLETMEQQRQEKMELEIDRINQEKIKKDMEQQRKREALKQRKYAQDKTSGNFPDEMRHKNLTSINQ